MEIINLIIFFGSNLFNFILGLVVIILVVVYIVDVSQNKQALRRNYPVVAHFRYFFEKMGTFFRQYFFAHDREEMPFNRAQRSWTYRAAKKLDSTQAFGSTREIKQGSYLFVNSAYPVETSQNAARMHYDVVIGEGCENPYTAQSFFNISGMSYGALSQSAITALSFGAKGANCWLNTGEGGLAPYHEKGGCDIVFQIGTAKYGCRDEEGNLCYKTLQQLAAKPHIKMFEIKLSQGAKPGKGGILPAVKVNEEIAGIRGIPAYQESVSPCQHADIKNEENLLHMIDSIRKETQKPVGIKLVMGGPEWIKIFLQKINDKDGYGAPDFITLDSSEGGTGASPLSLIDYVGLSILETLPMLDDALRTYGLRDKIKIIASGKLITPAEVAWAFCVGADFVSSARGPMFSLGCIQALQCNKNTCPTGITTHNKRLQKGLNSRLKSTRVTNYIEAVRKETFMIANSCGVERVNLLERKHCRIVGDFGKSHRIDELFPQ